VQDLLIGQSVDPDVRAAMQRFVEQQPEVKRVFNMITLQLGPEIMVAIKAEMNRFLSPKDMIDDINRVEERFKAQFPEVKWSFFEPDLRD